MRLFLLYDAITSLHPAADDAMCTNKQWPLSCAIAAFDETMKRKNDIVAVMTSAKTINPLVNSQPCHGLKATQRGLNHSWVGKEDQQKTLNHLINDDDAY